MFLHKLRHPVRAAAATAAAAAVGKDIRTRVNEAAAKTAAEEAGSGRLDSRAAVKGVLSSPEPRFRRLPPSAAPPKRFLLSFSQSTSSQPKRLAVSTRV